MKSTNTKKGSFLRNGLLLAALAISAGPAWGQCTCTQVLSASPAYGVVVEVSSGTLCIGAGVTVSGAAIRVTGNDVTICNQGTISDNYSGNGYGVIDVASGITGTVINNLGTINTQTTRLRAALTLNNGSSDGGATVVAGAMWQGDLFNSVTVAPVVHNYAAWSGQMRFLPGGTITNANGATWSGYLSTSANLTITNAGTWSSQVQEAGNRPTINIIQNGGSWTGGVGGGDGSLRIINNATWTQGFNFPSGSANTFINTAGATASFNGYWGLGGTVALVNNGAMNVNNGMANIGSASSLVNAAGSTFALTGDFNNDGTVANQGTITGTGNFTNNGTITGATVTQGRGLFRIANYTVNNNSFGADGSYLDFCDGTPPSPASNGFDARNGTIGTNVVYCAPATPIGPLPVLLTSFSAQRRAGQVLVQWATASELNNKEFVVERSADGHAFVALQTVAGRGTLAYASTYAATDAHPLPGLSYYRLRQVDHDGTRTYSPVASVSQLATEVAAYPNPTADVLTLDLSGLPAGPCQVRLRSLPGQLVLSQTLAAGQAQPLSLASLPAGTYLLEVASATQGRQVQRVVKR